MKKLEITEDKLRDALDRHLPKARSTQGTRSTGALARKCDMIRYRLKDTIASFRVILDDGTESELIHVHGRCNAKTVAEQDKAIVFADVLEPSGANALAKIKFYFPDGSIVIGRQFVRSFLELHHIGEPLDGRFNTP